VVVKKEKAFNTEVAKNAEFAEKSGIEQRSK
jgi:hypothetical protein